MSSIRVGFGHDVHQLKEGLPLLVGGVSIPHSSGAYGHSDADVLIHAIMDALLGACDLRDIGQHFPNSDPSLKGADSKLLLAQVVGMMHECGFKLSNVDATVCLQQPSISDYIPQMKQSLADILMVGKNQVSIKATTTERLGYIGSGHGISAYAVVLVSSR